MRHIPACITEDEARRLFEEKGFWAHVYSTIFPPPHSPELKLPRLELIYFPYYLVEIAVSSSKGPGTVQLSVEGCSGAFAFFEQSENFIGDMPQNGDVFSPSLDEAKAQEIARDELLSATMRRRSTHGEKPYATGVVDCGLFHYPLWVYYYERRKGRISVMVRDAVVGAPIGNRTRNGILQAFIEKRGMKQEKL